VAWFECVLHVGAQETTIAIPGGLLLILVACLLLRTTKGPKSEEWTESPEPTAKD
jgi:hypothetical protein